MQGGRGHNNINFLDLAREWENEINGVAVAICRWAWNKVDAFAFAFLFQGRNKYIRLDLNKYPGALLRQELTLALMLLVSFMSTIINRI